MILTVTTVGSILGQGGQSGFGGGAGGFGGGNIVPDGSAETTETLILTPGQPSEWGLEIEEGETVFVTVTTVNFDPEAWIVDSEENELIRNDDIVKGDQRSRLVHTFDKEGDYKIMVGSFESKLGGQYEMSIRKFKPELAELNETKKQTPEESGYQWVRFEAPKETTLLVRIEGRSARDAEFYDTLGNEIEDVGTNYLDGWVFVSETEGFYYAKFVGSDETSYEFSALTEVQKETVLEKGPSHHNSTSDAIVTYSFAASTGDLIQLESEARGASTYIFHKDVPLPEAMDKEEIKDEQIMPIWSREKYGGRKTIFVRKDTTIKVSVIGSINEAIESAVTLTKTMPAMRLNASSSGNLKVGDYDTWEFEGRAGDVIRLTGEAATFDFNMHVYDPDGRDIEELCDISSENLNASDEMVLTKTGKYFVIIHSYGNGGGGSYSLGHSILPAKNLAFETVQTGEMADDGYDIWSFGGKKDQTILISMRSTDFSPSFYLYKANGEVLNFSFGRSGSDQKTITMKLPEDGTYKILIRGDDGKYKLKLMDFDFAS